MATFREKAVHSVYHMFFLYYCFVVYVISNFGFEGGTVVLISSVPGHCLLFTFDTYKKLDG